MRLSPVLLVAAALAACSPSEPAKPERPAVAGGERLVVRPAPIADVKVVAGTVGARDTAEARARIGGPLVSLGVREGDTVRKGQLIGRVVDQRLDFETSAAGAQVAAAAAEASRAQAELARTKQLYENGVYAKARLEQVEASARTAQSLLAAARAQRSASAEMSGQGAILAPSDGRVLRADVPAGSVVVPGQSIATITSGPPVLRLEIPEADARHLSVGDTVSVAPEDLPAAGAATITQVYPAVTGGHVTVDVTVPGLRPDLVGQRVRVRVPVGRRTAMVIPGRFVARRYGLDFVRVLDRSGRASEVAVQLAPALEAGKVEVLSGLAAGDVILAAPGR